MTYQERMRLLCELEKTLRCLKLYRDQNGNTTPMVLTNSINKLISSLSSEDTGTEFKRTTFDLPGV